MGDRYLRDPKDTLGDNCEATRRLRSLAEVYEPETRALLNSVGSAFSDRFELGVDLGYGPGWSTQLIAATSSPARIMGLDSSECFIAEARSNQPQFEFIRHDILESPFPIENPDFLFCRFLLTHLLSPSAALQCWADVSKPKAVLAILEPNL